eukprot:CAMPEP_0114975274 /NCGR_PEP_ID=MMETSP0216-20121206/2001_1 /TAXON_ID=223996 /ORGANISM="Protocruzia adherens, Strain Boccale" /LENGTH=108 /DNA_ID=CAMNT_0002336023 /DNA_START=533 /DNA_END=856 /DNA_ORIENTATION=+
MNPDQGVKKTLASLIQQCAPNLENLEMSSNLLLPDTYNNLHFPLLESLKVINFDDPVDEDTEMRDFDLDLFADEEMDLIDSLHEGGENDQQDAKMQKDSRGQLWSRIE